MEKFFKFVSGIVAVVFFVTSSVSAGPLKSTLRPSSEANTDAPGLKSSLIASSTDATRSTTTPDTAPRRTKETAPKASSAGKIVKVQIGDIYVLSYDISRFWTEPKEIEQILSDKLDPKAARNHGLFNRYANFLRYGPERLADRLTSEIRLKGSYQAELRKLVLECCEHSNLGSLVIPALAFKTYKNDNTHLLLFLKSPQESRPDIQVFVKIIRKSTIRAGGIYIKVKFYLVDLSQEQILKLANLFTPKEELLRAARRGAEFIKQQFAKSSSAGKVDVDRLFADLESPDPRIRKITVQELKTAYPELKSTIEVYYESLPVSGLNILSEIKKRKAPVPALNIDLGELSAELQIPAFMKAQRETNAAIIYEVGPGAILTFADDRPQLPEYLARAALEIKYAPPYAFHYAPPYVCHLDHNQLTKVKVDKYITLSPQDRKRALYEEPIKRALKEALDDGFTSIALDLSTLMLLEEKDVNKRLEHVIETTATVLWFVAHRAKRLGIRVSIEIEVGDIGKEISTPEEATTLYKGVLRKFQEFATEASYGKEDEIRDAYIEELLDRANIVFLAAQLGSSHGYDINDKDRLEPYEGGVITEQQYKEKKKGYVISRAGEIVQAFIEKLNRKILIAYHEFSSFPLELVSKLIGTGAGKVNINTDSQAEIWKVLQAWYPALYRELFDEAYNLAQEAKKKQEENLRKAKDTKDPEKIKKAQEALDKISKVVTAKGIEDANFKQDRENDFIKAKNRIIFGQEGAPGARKVFRGEKGMALLRKITDTLRDGTERKRIVKDDYYNIRLEVVDDPENGLTAREAIHKLGYERLIKLIKGLGLEGSADGCVVDREAELRLQKWQLNELRKKVEKINKNNIVVLEVDKDNVKAFRIGDVTFHINMGALGGFVPSSVKWRRSFAAFDHALYHNDIKKMQQDVEAGKYESIISVNRILVRHCPYLWLILAKDESGRYIGPICTGLIDKEDENMPLDANGLVTEILPVDKDRIIQDILGIKEGEHGYDAWGAYFDQATTKSSSAGKLTPTKVEKILKEAVSEIEGVEGEMMADYLPEYVEEVVIDNLPYKELAKEIHSVASGNEELVRKIIELMTLGYISIRREVVTGFAICKEVAKGKNPSVPSLDTRGTWALFTPAEWKQQKSNLGAIKFGYTDERYGGVRYKDVALTTKGRARLWVRRNVQFMVLTLELPSKDVSRVVSEAAKSSSAGAVKRAKGDDLESLATRLLNEALSKARIELLQKSHTKKLRVDSDIRWDEVLKAITTAATTESEVAAIVEAISKHITVLSRKRCTGYATNHLLTDPNKIPTFDNKGWLFHTKDEWKDGVSHGNVFMQLTRFDSGPDAPDYTFVGMDWSGGYTGCAMRNVQFTKAIIGLPKSISISKIVSTAKPSSAGEVKVSINTEIEDPSRISQVSIDGITFIVDKKPEVAYKIAPVDSGIEISSAAMLLYLVNETRVTGYLQQGTFLTPRLLIEHKEEYEKWVPKGCSKWLPIKNLSDSDVLAILEEFNIDFRSSIYKVWMEYVKQQWPNSSILKNWIEKIKQENADFSAKSSSAGTFAVDVKGINTRFIISNNVADYRAIPLPVMMDLEIMLAFLEKSPVSKASYKGNLRPILDKLEEMSDLSPTFVSPGQAEAVLGEHRVYGFKDAGPIDVGNIYIIFPNNPQKELLKVKALAEWFEGKVGIVVSEREIRPTSAVVKPSSAGQVESIMHGIAEKLAGFFAAPMDKLNREAVGELKAALSEQKDRLTGLGKLSCPVENAARAEFATTLKGYMKAIDEGERLALVNDGFNKILGDILQNKTNLKLHHYQPAETDVIGTIIINEDELQTEQRRDIVTLLKKGGEYRTGLIKRLGVNVVLKNEYNSNEDYAPHMVAISKTPIPGAEKTRLLDITIEHTPDGLLPIDKALLFAKGLLLYLITDRDLNVEMELSELYRLLKKGEGKSLEHTALLDEFIYKRIFKLVLPKPEPIDKQHYHRRLKIRLMTWISA